MPLPPLDASWFFNTLTGYANNATIAPGATIPNQKAGGAAHALTLTDGGGAAFTYKSNIGPDPTKETTAGIRYTGNAYFQTDFAPTGDFTAISISVVTPEYDNRVRDLSSSGGLVGRTGGVNGDNKFQAGGLSIEGTATPRAATPTQSLFRVMIYRRIGDKFGISTNGRPFVESATGAAAINVGTLSFGCRDFSSDYHRPNGNGDGTAALAGAAFKDGYGFSDADAKAFVKDFGKNYRKTSGIRLIYNSFGTDDGSTPNIKPANSNMAALAKAALTTLLPGAYIILDASVGRKFDAFPYAGMTDWALGENVAIVNEFTNTVAQGKEDNKTGAALTTYVMEQATTYLNHLLADGMDKIGLHTLWSGGTNNPDAARQAVNAAIPGMIAGLSDPARVSIIPVATDNRWGVGDAASDYPTYFQSEGGQWIHTQNALDTPAAQEYDVPFVAAAFTPATSPEVQKLILTVREGRFGSNARAITPSNTVLFPEGAAAVYVGTAGDIVCDGGDGQPQFIKGVPVGFSPLITRRVYVSATVGGVTKTTTAADMTAIY